MGKENLLLYRSGLIRQMQKKARCRERLDGLLYYERKAA
jgi:hypothetical protein